MKIVRKIKPLDTKLLVHARKIKVDLPPPEPPTAIDEAKWQKTWDLFNKIGYKCVAERRKRISRLKQEGKLPKWYS